MSVPLDKLYSFLQSLCGDDVLIYRYFPHGSRNISDCRPLIDPNTMPKVAVFNKMFTFCHDQEPLNLDYLPKIAVVPLPGKPFNVYRMVSSNILNRYDQVIVVHSELNSSQVQWLSDTGAVPVYWWSHAVIALDWFRYAKIDPSLSKASRNVVNDFLIYNRAWQGTREYRLKFVEMLLDNHLQTHCQMNFNPVDGVHYKDYQFANNDFALHRFDLEQNFALNATCSTASADYDSNDYNRCGIEIVLETLFDDTRLHLTEKTLRPIACAHPFVLAGPPGSLAYLRRYGFKTFAPYLDESYDLILDPVERLQAVIDLMKHIAKLPSSHKTQLWHQLQSIANYNRARFFSEDFFEDVIQEFLQNFNQATAVMKNHQTGAYFKRVAKQALNTNFFVPASADEIDTMLKMLDQCA